MTTAQDRFRQSNSRLPEGLVIGSDYSINPMPGQQAFDLAAATQPEISEGSEVMWDQPLRGGRLRSMRGPVLKVEPSGWLTVRSRQCNMIFAVHRDNAVLLPSGY